ncbi:MAG: GNAT family N-acetyltransferase [Hyphomicrobiales bacterium]|nr:GNAT family N-acetyltransferase [Hyphomicrobiales bacterium]
MRHEIFVRERNWHALKKPDNRERDQFDTSHTIHFAVIQDDEVVGYARMLPTLRPHLLSDVYPQLVDGGNIPRGPDIYEWTRHCVARKCRGRSPLNPTEREIILGIFEYCVNNGITRITGQGSPAWITRMLEMGLDVTPLGLPQIIDCDMIVAMIATVTERTLRLARRIMRCSGSVIEDRALEQVGESEPAPALRMLGND